MDISLMPAQASVLYKPPIREADVEPVDLPDVSPPAEEIIHHPAEAALVAVDEQNRICLLRRYRQAVREWVWELPTGDIEIYDIPILAAQRELEQEAGLHGNVWTALGPILSAPDFCDEVVHLFLVRDLHHINQDPDSVGRYEIHWVNFHEALTWVYMGKIRDAKTVAGLFHAQAHVVNAKEVM